MTEAMTCHPLELWRNASPLLNALEGIGARPKDAVQAEMLDLLGFGSSAVPPESVPSAEDFEYALVSVVLTRLEKVSDLVECTADCAEVKQVIDVLDVAASVVEELFRQTTSPGAAKEDTEKCRTWWLNFVNVAEDVARVAPVQLLYSLVDNLEVRLERLRLAYLQMAGTRLAELDAKKAADQEAAAKASKEDGGDGKTQKEQAKNAKDEETKRAEERKKTIIHLGISPNGQLYLAITSLLKQLSSRLPGTTHATLRSRVSLLLERLLAMDHKAIANNQKLRTTEFHKAQDLDADAESILTEAAAKAAAGASATEPSQKQAAGTASARDDAGGALSKDPAIDHSFYRTFWGLQEALQLPERIFDKTDGWSTFQKAVSKVLQLFIKYPLKGTTPKQPWAPPEPMPLRHAPCARSLGVQLDDPGFRLQFLTQVAIALQALEQDGTQRRTDKGSLMTRQPETVRSSFQALKKMVDSAAAATQAGYSSLLRHVVEREQHWVAWKVHGCREFERDSLEMLNAKVTPSDQLRSGLPSTRPKTKPALPGYLGKVLGALKDPQWKGAATGASESGAEAKSTRLHSMYRLCDANLERLIEDDKPENGIEEEYKAKRNKVFMWQVRRLFCQQHLRVYSQKDMSTKQDFMDFVNAVRGKPAGTATGSATAATGAAAPPDAAQPGEGVAEDGAEDAGEEVAEEAGEEAADEGAATAAAEASGEQPAADTPEPGPPDVGMEEPAAEADAGVAGASAGAADPEGADAGAVDEPPAAGAEATTVEGRVADAEQGLKRSSKGAADGEPAEKKQKL